ncbi:MAG TPA: ABC transporter permease [Terriglobia bacterium]|nr:ABC transporter permease [Terriglobia bacterium]
MSTQTAVPVLQKPQRLANIVPDFLLGFENLRMHKMRSLLTMLGMIFGVAAVVAMLSIGAGAQQRVMAFIEQLGVRNLIVEAKESDTWQEYRKVRTISPGLTFQDYRVIGETVGGIATSTPRKRFSPTKMIPRPQQTIPVVYGVNPVYQEIAGLRLEAGRFFNSRETTDAAAVCVLGEGAQTNLFGPEDPVGKYVKVDDQWFQVIGVVAPQLAPQNDVSGLPSEDVNNLIYVPLDSVIYRLENSKSEYHDEIDGIYLRLKSDANSPTVASVVRGVLNGSHHGAGDFSIVVPAELLAQQKRTQRLFETVMVAIASISLLVGGIGIMNIMLASILERTHEIGLRRAIGARKTDIIRQFVIEAILISFVGGIIGILFGFGMSRAIAWAAGWSTIVTAGSILLAFLVSVSVGLGFGIYPAVQAARLDPVEALRYE